MTEAAIKEADELFEAKDFKKEHEILTNIHKEHPDDVEVLWRLCRSYFSLSEDTQDKNEKKELVTKGVDLARRGLELNDKHWATHKWFAILIGTLGEFIPTKEKIGNSFQIKEHALKALELKPDDGSVMHMLGKWCYAVANIGWLERTAASALFATPPSATFEEALEWFLKSQEAIPSVRNAILIGDTYVALKQAPKAKEWYKKASELPYKGAAEEQFHNEAVQKAK